MIAGIHSFNASYDSYYKELAKYLSSNLCILEIGGGAHPSVTNREKLTYYIVDPDKRELDKAPDDIIKLNMRVQDIQNMKYDLIISKMVLEHIENPDEFHMSTLKILKEDGIIIHFFACRHSIPSFMNRLLPESTGEMILKWLKNRNTIKHPKYPSYYRKTKGHTKSQIKYFKSMGFKIISYQSFVGHKFFRRIPVLKTLEEVFTKTLIFLKLKHMATVALIVLKKE